MLKINIQLKFALIALFLGGGIVLAFMYGFWYALLPILIGLGFLASYLLLGTIQSAAELIQVSDFEGAEKRLGLTFFPNLLYVTNRAIYFIMKGSIAAQQKRNKDAEEYLQKALTLKLPSENEKAMVLLQLANLEATKNNWNGAKAYFTQAKKLKVTESMIKQQFDHFEKVLNNRSQMNLARSMGKQGMQMMQGGGGKRRRPLMR